MRSIAIVAALGYAAVLAPSLDASDLDGVTIHGFVSQSYLRTSTNQYLGLDSKKGTFAFTEEALNFTVSPSSRLRIGAQLIGRDVGPQGNHKVTVDWALADYRLADQLGLRAGKVKLPLGLYNTVTDVDVARPEVLQPDGVYPQRMRDFRLAFQGGELYGTLGLGRAGQLDYEAWTGTVDIDDAFLTRRFAAEGATQLLPALAPLGLRGTAVHLDEAVGSAGILYGAALEWRPPAAGLRLRASGVREDADVLSTATYSGYVGAAPVSIKTRTSTYVAERYWLFFSAEYQRGGLRLSMEHQRTHWYTQASVTGLPMPGPLVVSRDRKGTATYGQVAWRFDPRFQVSAYYEVDYPDGADKQGRKLVLAGQPDHGAWRKDLALSARFDVNANWLVKAEWHIIDGTAELSPLDNPQGPGQDWQLFTARLTFHF